MAAVRLLAVGWLCTLAAATTVSVQTDNVTHQINPLFMGCHSDSGFAHTQRNFYSQMIYGESFEFGNQSSWDYKPNAYDAAPTAARVKWNSLITGKAAGSVSFDQSAAHHGYASLKLEHAGGGGEVAATNRGIGNEGLFIQAKEYEGYLFAKAGQAGARLVVSLRDYTTSAVLASQTIELAPTSEWTQYKFRLSAAAAAECKAVPEGSNPQVDCHVMRGGMAGPPTASQGHICIQCFGEFAVGLDAPGTVHVDYVFLQPGQWGRYGEGPFVKDGLQVLKDMGITTIRLGGSFTDPSYYFWKNWRGNPWERQSLGAKWGSEIVSGFGPFEFIDMCAELGIEPVVTTTGQAGGSVPCCNASDMADLIEYTWGDSDTRWGKQRADDGHPEPYQLRYVELGNEQYNTDYPKQVAAMEARAKAIGKPDFFYYLSPNNGKWLDEQDAAAVEALGLGTRVLSDLHVGAGGGVEAATALFTSHPNNTMGAANAETNDGTHTMLRAAKEAADLNEWFNCFAVDGTGAFCDRLKFRTASFCNERSGHFDAFDQGISMFLPNMTWIQPPGYVHVMYSQTWHANGLSVQVSSDHQECDFYAFFKDHGCRTWSGNCTQATWPGGPQSTPTLHKNVGHGAFPVVGTNVYCSEQPVFQDGPAATASDEACQQQCLKGAPPVVSASAQKSEDGTELVLRLANPGDNAAVVAVDFEGADQWTLKEQWMLSSPAADLATQRFDANTPAEPTRIAPVKTVSTTSAATRSITVAPISIVVNVYTNSKH